MTITDGGGIFIFYDKSICVCIREPEKNEADWSVGEYCNTVKVDFFDDFNSPITIQNQ